MFQHGHFHPRHHHPDGEGGFGGGRGRHFHGEGHFQMHWEGEGRCGGWGGSSGWGGPGGRARRGEARYLLLDTLHDGPKHGYEIIKTLEERSGGQYTPSPGTVYPTLQYLEDAGLVRASQDAERRVFELTDAGKVELDARAEEIAAFWARMNQASIAPTLGPEMDYLRQEMQDVIRTVRTGIPALAQRGDRETIRAIRQTLERCKNELRDLVAASATEPKDSTDKSV